MTAQFAHASEAEMSRILDFYAVRWEYEPHTFPILWNLDGDVVESFSPDFYLPDLELYLELTYQFDTGKLHGLARLTIEIDVFIFSGSVTIECERTFAGSKGDPTFVEMMAVEPDGSSDPWTEYCAAFAAVEA